MEKRLFTSECVTVGHPDKVADSISDAILDACFAQDPHSRVACETMVTTNFCIICGEITTKATVDYAAVAREAIRKIGYVYPGDGFDADTVEIQCRIHTQSPDIALGTNVIGTDNVLHAAIDEGVSRVVCLSTDKAAYPINAMGKSKAMMESIIYANARNGAGRTTICCTRYGNVMCSRGSVIPLFIDRIRKGEPLTVTDPNMTRFLMNLDEAVDLVQFAFEHANPGDLFIQKAPASTIGDLAEAVQEVFGRVGTQIIGTRHGEKLYETLMTREERLRAEDMGEYFRVACDSRDLNYDKFVVKGDVKTQADEAYTSDNTERLDVAGTIAKIKSAEYVQLALEGREGEAVQ